ncbi:MULTISPECIES: helix-turn-helix transcriptional regulator [unclassified Microcoleus]|uniref:helix-turn-helix domain-containing protein n=1 Tax=unclassified Microcoleus TaxID=2642155 RepID=UPI002FD5DD0E
MASKIYCSREEQKLQEFSIATRELIGLTKREAEVQFWIAKDQSNAQIAKVLGYCEGTVPKYLEHLYKKLYKPGRRL